MDWITPFAGIGGLVALILVTLLLVVFTVTRFWKRASPNEAAVITGRKYKNGEVSRGYRYVVGGGFLLIPVIEKLEFMKLNVFSVKIRVEDVPDVHGALVTVDAIANVKVASTDELLPLAIERFLGLSQAEIEGVVKDTLEGNLRAIVGRMELEALLRDRQAFQGNVLNEAGTDLGKLGLQADVLNIKDIRDPRNYIESLGKKRTAEVVRDATIGEAEAQRDADKKSAEARLIGEKAKAESEKSISDADRDRDVAIAENNALVEARRAQIPLKAQVAEAEIQSEVNVAEIGAERAMVESQIALEEVRQRQQVAALNATIVVQADKEREAVIITADGERQAIEINAQAEMIASTKKGEGIKALQTGEAEGRKALASAEQTELEAKAAGNQAGLLAQATGETALAEALRARLMAEADGIKAKADAYKELDDGARLLMLLEALPPVLESGGLALERIITPAAKAIGEGLGNIDELRLIDLGGGAGGANGNLLAGFANTPTETLFKLWEKVKALGGEDIATDLLAKAGIDISNLGGVIEAAKEAVVETPKPASMPAKRPTPTPSPKKQEPSKSGPKDPAQK